MNIELIIPKLGIKTAMSLAIKILFCNFSLYNTFCNWIFEFKMGNDLANNLQDVSNSLNICVMHKQA